MDRNALAELLQALESRRDAEERRREERYTALIERICVADGDKASLLDAPIIPGHTFGPAVDDMLQHSHRARESTKELVDMLPKSLPPVRRPAPN
ncbi:UNVERIFIED_CONTAM: hypothetical protein FKN15_055760 [Acipenser sinensis]